MTSTQASAAAPRPKSAVIRFLQHRRRVFSKNWELLLLCIPAIAAYLLFQYAPMVGLQMAFRNYRYDRGLFHSEWTGFKNFEFLFRSIDLARIVRNSVLYSLTFLILGTICNVVVALLLFEINNRRWLKFYQTVMTFPNFLSWVVVGFVTYAVFNPSIGVLNQVLAFFGHEGVNVYGSPKYWPYILTYMNLWKNVGMGCIMYYAALMGIDPSLYEAATIDGANRWQQTIHISLPSLTSLITIMSILGIGGLFGGDFGLFYQIPRNIGVLYPTTDIINTYVYRGLAGGDYGMSSATGLVQSVVGLVLVVATNLVVKKISPENSMF